MLKLRSLAKGTKRSLALLIAIGGCLLAARPMARAEPPPVTALGYEKGFLVTGGYAVGSVDFQQGSASNGFVTGTINMSGIPANADIVAAYLYWQTIATNKTQVKLPTFRDQKIAAAKETVKPLDPSIAPCYSGGSSNNTYTMYGFRADVLRLLPSKLDTNGIHVLVNNSDLQSNGQALTTVKMPDAGSGNNSPTTAGATLFVVYRDPVSPLTSISLYDGIAVQTPGATTEHTFAGFLGAPADAVARMTQIVSGGASNSSERLYFNNTLLAANPFAGGSPSSDRSWTTATYDVGSTRVGGSLMGGKADSTVYGETVTTKIDHTSTSPYECLSWSAMIFSTTVRDADHDGLPDRLEESSGLSSPDDKPLPQLSLMGASPLRKDVFVEVGAMTADGTETYGGQPGAAHNHLPTAAVLKLVGDAYKNAPVVNPGPTTGIAVHFDVGAGYNSALGPLPEDGNVNEYLVPPGLARGGETMKEVDCATLDPNCQFKGYPGTVSWKIGFQVLRDAPVDPSGNEIFSETQLAACKTEAANCRRRFDSERMNFFRYALYAHSRGKPKDACLTGTPEEQAECKANPASNFHVPSTASGIADLPGGDLMVTLGGWGHGFVGSTFVQASTTAHEMGHGAWLTHGGSAASILEPNCKSNYLSVMNYLFQLTGLRDEAGTPHLDYSTSTLGDALNETALPSGPSNPTQLQYRTAFFAPILPGTLPALLGTPAASRFCNGAPFPNGGQNPFPPSTVQYGRVDLYSATIGAIDWSAGLNNGTTQQDINFDGQLETSLAGFNDWAGLRLDQIGSRRNMGGFSLGIELEFGVDVSGGEDLFGVDVSGGDSWDGVDYFGVDVSGGMDFTGDIDYFGVDVSGGIDDLMFGVDVSGGGIDPFGVDVSGGREIDRETARDLGNSPANNVKACVLGTGNCTGGTAAQNHRVKITWKTPDVGTAASYSVYRVQGSTVTPSSTKTLVGGADVPGTDLSVVDPTELPNGVAFTYFVIVHFTDGANSSPSNFSTITAVNDAPVGVNDPLTIVTGTTLNATVTVNDTDSDSLVKSTWTATLVAGSGPTSANAFTFNANGTFSYTPKNGFTGTDSFQYRVNNGTWPVPAGTAMSTNSNVVTVTITVTKKK